jgi:hypothetical protein
MTNPNPIYSHSIIWQPVSEVGLLDKGSDWENNWAEDNGLLHGQTMEVEQILAHLLAKMNVMQERMEAKTNDG